MKEVQRSKIAVQQLFSAVSTIFKDTEPLYDYLIYTLESLLSNKHLFQPSIFFCLLIGQLDLDYHGNGSRTIFICYSTV